MITIVIGGTAAMVMSSNRASQAAGLLPQLERLIEQDLAVIDDLDERYTCCPGSCTTTAATIDAAFTAGDCATGSSGDGSQNFYAPLQPLASPSDPYSTAMTAFRSSCANGSVANNLIAAFPAVPTAPAGATLTRSTPSVVDSAAHRVQWTYTGSINGSTVVSRVVNLIPRAAGWCP